MKQFRVFIRILSMAWLFLFVTKIAIAHPGGHYLPNDVFNTWTLASGRTIEGNFLMAHDNTIVLEQKGGGRITVFVDLLSDQDKALALFKIRKYNTLNEQVRVNQPADLSLLELAFEPYQPTVTTSSDENYFYVSSRGIANHPMMIGITSWQQQVPIPQNYSGSNAWPIPLRPVLAETPMSTRNNFMRGAIAIAVNGIPIFNALNNRGEDAYLIGELDNWGGHCGKGDDYHYHTAPLHLSAISLLKPIAFALDGFAVYGEKEPDGSAVLPLDECHGHFAANGLYHYHGTKNYPYRIAAMRGKVNTDNKTPAPENQILPQAFTAPVRPPLKPLRGAVITNCVATANNAFSITYKIAGKNGSVNYYWDEKNSYYFTFIDTDGNQTTASYERRNGRKKD